VWSYKKVWWQCSNGHEWEATVISRTHNKLINDCPYCGDREVLEGYNDILTLFPKLCEEWNYEMNGVIVPNQITQYFREKVWWKCRSCGYEWKTSIKSRINGSSCSVCAIK